MNIHEWSKYQVAFPTTIVYETVPLCECVSGKRASVYLCLCVGGKMATAQRGTTK